MTKAFDCALGLLTRREHGAHELKEKLVHKGYSRDEAELALVKCQALELQSDERYVDVLLRTRIRQGYGPQKIIQDLKQKKIDSELINQVIHQEEIDWLTHALAVWKKKEKGSLQLDFADLQKIKRFLLYRGFPSDVIRQAEFELKSKA